MARGWVGLDFVKLMKLFCFAYYLISLFYETNISCFEKWKNFILDRDYGLLHTTFVLP